jgi:hypothetical protein
MSPLATPAILKTYSDVDHRRRLENIRIGNETIRACLRKHLITSYLPAQCCYNLGEFPCLAPRGNPDQFDERELDGLQAHGIQLIQVHDEWNNANRLPGGDRMVPLNSAGFRRFVDLVHQRGMKLIVYASTGFCDRRDPEFRAEWARPGDLAEVYWRAARCSPASPGWRAHLLPRLMRILDEYGVDGFYDDLGYRRLASHPRPPTQDEVLAFEESDRSDGALADLLALVHAEVNRRGGILKVHFSACNRPLTDAKVYDYLWVGESVANIDNLRRTIKDHPPYVVPCLDMSRARIANEDELYLNAIPYLQFPLLLAGRPFTGQRATIPGIHYPAEKDCFWTRHCRAIWKFYQAHPDGPHSYGWWDSVPGRPEARPTHARWLKQYQPLVEEGTWAWLEVRDSNLFTQSLPRDVVASVFANRNLYVVLANYSQNPATVQSNAQYVRVAPKASRIPATRWELPARSLAILQRSALA